MKKINIISTVVLAIVLLGIFLYTKNATAPVTTSNQSMSFFVTSVNPGKGGDLGGLDGADAYCSSLAENAGVTNKTWKAYLTTTGEKGEQARDRIGSGPWYNAKGELVAQDIENLHGENFLTKETALNEYGQQVQGRGDTANMHDILTGSMADGTASTTAMTDTTCANWTSSSAGSALVGHHDRVGRDESEPMKSWNSSHATRGCDMESLKQTGGAGLFYCFAQE